MALTLVGTALCVCLSFAGEPPPHLKWCIEHSEARVFTNQTGKTFRYRIAEKKAPAGQKVPLVILMHGAGERGVENTK